MSSDEVSSRKYTLYLDETGDWGYPNYDPRRPILCLCGTIVKDDYHARGLLTALRNLKREKFGSEGIVLHRYKISGGSDEFRNLKTQRRREAIISQVSQFIGGLDIKILIAALDKVDHYKTYGVKKVDEWLPKDIYSMLFIFIVERFFAFLRECQGKGNIIAERRGRTEDNRLQHWYSTILQNGTQFYRGWQFQKVLPTAIEFRKRTDNIAGLQVSDWIATAMSKKVEYPDGCQDQFGEWELYKGKIWVGRNAPARGQIGLKTFPKNLGRKLLNMPLKSA